MRRQSQHCQAVKENPVDDGVPEVFGRQQHDKSHYKVCIDHQEPGHDGTDHATAIPDEPDPLSHVSLRGGGGGVVALIVGQERVVLNIAETVP